MSEYGSGLTLGQCCNYDKERIKHALKGELMIGEDENGFVYETASREECENYILKAYDNCVYQAVQLADGGRAMERLAENHGIDWKSRDILHEYMALMSEEERKNNDYVYEKES